MPIFDYRAKEQDGDMVEGVVESDNEDLAIALLEEQNLYVVTLTERSGSFFSNLGGDLLSKVNFKDVVVFSRQLSVMVSATLPIVKSLRILIKQTSSIPLKSVISEVADDVEAGSKLSVALEKHPHVFNEFYINMIRSGETSGKLGEVLNFLADQQEKDYDLMSKVKGAMIYPAFILSGLFVVGTIMMVWVVPKITDLVRGIGAELPLSTRILISVSDFMVAYWWLMGMGLAGAIIGLRFYLKTEPGRRLFDTFLLNVPVFKNIFQKIYLVRFTRGLSTLIVGKVPLTQGLEVVSGVVQNRVYQDLIQRTIREVEDGNSISTVFSKSKVIPSMLANMLSVGEQTGRLEEVLEKMTDFYTRELDNLITNLVSLIEPIILIVMGIAVGIMVSAILMPMFNLASQL